MMRGCSKHTAAQSCRAPRRSSRRLPRSRIKIIYNKTHRHEACANVCTRALRSPQSGQPSASQRITHPCKTRTHTRKLAQVAAVRGHLRHVPHADAHTASSRHWKDLKSPCKRTDISPHDEIAQRSQPKDVRWGLYLPSSRGISAEDPPTIRTRSIGRERVLRTVNDLRQHLPLLPARWARPRPCSSCRALRASLRWRPHPMSWGPVSAP